MEVRRLRGKLGLKCYAPFPFFKYRLWFGEKMAGWYWNLRKWGEKSPDCTTELNIIEVDAKLKFNSRVIFSRKLCRMSRTIFMVSDIYIWVYNEQMRTHEHHSTWLDLPDAWNETWERWSSFIHIHIYSANINWAPIMYSRLVSWCDRKTVLSRWWSERLTCKQII